jgi:hypothetical protein
MRRAEKQRMETDGGPRSRTPTLHASLLSGGRARTTARASRASEPSPMGRSIFSEERSGTHRASKSLPFVPPATRVTSASDSIRRALSGGEPAVRKLKKPPLWPRSVCTVAIAFACNASPLQCCYCRCRATVSNLILGFLTRRVTCRTGTSHRKEINSESTHTI